ncbi:MAG: protein translocase subunit SecD [Candidatus Roizmanbacteria bacterium]|nr:protein translocase subunit SecD [Candidatus Roizmanbacteria bacterium]
MQNPRRTIFIIFLLTLLAIGISIPEDVPLRFSLFGYTIDRELRPLQLNIVTERLRIQKKPETVLGLDIAGGVRLVYEADMSQIADVDRERALIATRNTIERRVNMFGVSEPNIQTSNVGDSHRIIVEMPGVTEAEQAKALIGQTAQLAFREFNEDVDASSSASIIPSLTNTHETPLTGKELQRAEVTIDYETGNPAVSLEFTSEGKDLFKTLTENNIGRPLPIFLDEFPITWPRVDVVIPDGQAIIRGGFSSEQAQSLSILLNSGALPVPIYVVEEKSIGPTLGQESVEKSILAGSIGLTLVMAFMWIYYGTFGFLANIALLIYGVVTYAIFRLIPITLTLPGIAGFILSIGMAVDSNILIFERIKEEVRLGKKWQVAMELGFGRAWDSIRDANVTTILTALILFNPANWDFLPQFGVARGFALTLLIGVIISLFTGIFVTRNLIRVFIRRK